MAHCKESFGNAYLIGSKTHAVAVNHEVYQILLKQF
jgi:hypothetical protein